MCTIYGCISWNVTLKNSNATLELATFHGENVELLIASFCLECNAIDGN
jgi:hypothetical protein